MRILIVDDDPLAGEMTEAILQDAGHETVLAPNGLEAARTLAEDGAFDMVVSDMNMPLVNGIDLFHELRGQGLNLPFLLLTGDEPAGLLAREPGLDGCLLKDFNLGDTLPAALAALGDARAQRE